MNNHGGPRPSAVVATRAVEEYLAELLDEVVEASDGHVQHEDSSAQWRDRDNVFEVRVVTVAGLTLAIPSAEIVACDRLSVESLKPDLKYLQAGLGLLRRSNTAAPRVLDFAALVLPAERRPVRTSRKPPPHVLILAGERWALACDGVGRSEDVDPQQVQWRDRQGQRPWLCGMLPMLNAALVDPQALVAAALLEEQG